MQDTTDGIYSMAERILKQFLNEHIWHIFYHNIIPFYQTEY